MKKVILIIVAVIVVIATAAGVYAIVNKSDQPTTTASDGHSHTHTDSESQTSTETTPSTEAAVEEVTITYGNSGFSPDTVTVKTGGKVTVKNDSDHAVQFDSDPHPAHTGNRELNAENIAPGKSNTFTVTRTGTFGYHNHLDSSETGTIIVQ